MSFLCQNGPSTDFLSPRRTGSPSGPTTCFLVPQYSASVPEGRFVRRREGVFVPELGGRAAVNRLVVDLVGAYRSQYRTWYCPVVPDSNTVVRGIRVPDVTELVLCAYRTWRIRSVGG
eukprot:784418-Rhodomonas_salina.1